MSDNVFGKLHTAVGMEPAPVGLPAPKNFTAEVRTGETTE